MASILATLVCLSGPYYSYGQSPCTIDLESPMCIITHAVIKGNLQAGGSNVFFPEVAIDACSEVRPIVIYTFPENKVFISSDFFRCGDKGWPIILLPKNRLQLAEISHPEI